MDKHNNKYVATDGLNMFLCFRRGKRAARANKRQLKLLHGRVL